MLKKGESQCKKGEPPDSGGSRCFRNWVVLGYPSGPHDKYHQEYY